MRTVEKGIIVPVGTSLSYAQVELKVPREARILGVVDLEIRPMLRRVQAYLNLWPELLREVRYPYFDRDLLEFMYAIPREQIVRMGQRRFLMKRALACIVSHEVLSRRRKAFVPPSPRTDSSREWPSTVEVGRHIAGSSVGIIDSDRFLEALQKARRDEDLSIGSLKRTLTLESWLRHLMTQGVLTDSTPSEKQTNCPALGAGQLQAADRPKNMAS